MKWRGGRRVALAERREVISDLADDVEDALDVRRAQARVDGELQSLLRSFRAGARGGELPEERQGGAHVNVRRLEVDAAAYGAAARERRVGGVDGVLVINVLDFGRHARRPHAPAVCESARVARGVAARALVELVEAGES